MEEISRVLEDCFGMETFTLIWPVVPGVGVNVLHRGKAQDLLPGIRAAVKKDHLLLCACADVVHEMLMQPLPNEEEG